MVKNTIFLLGTGEALSISPKNPTLLKRGQMVLKYPRMFQQSGNDKI